MGRRAGIRLIVPRLVAGLALVLSTTQAAAQSPFEYGFVSHRAAPVRLVAPTLCPRGELPGELLSRASLRSDDDERGSPLATSTLDYEALASGITPFLSLRGQATSGVDWLCLAGAVADAGVTTHVFRTQGFVRGSLLASFTAAGISLAATNEALRAFEQEAGLSRAVRGGDRFAALVERRVDASGRGIGEDRVVWAELRLYDRRTVAIHRFRPEGGTEQFWFADGRSVAGPPLKAPADARLMSSPFGKREGPTLGRHDAVHTGVDYALSPGTPVRAAAAGIVRTVEFDGGYGKWVQIGHASGLATAYAHLESFAPNLVPGLRVAQGAVIGFTGDTGLSTGPHLHYEVVVDGETVDPMTHAASVRAMLRGADLERFHTVFSDLLRNYAGMAPLARLSIR